MAAIPERLGKYPITGMLGRGAMGVVYRGYDPVIKRPVAIKTIRKELIDHEEGTEAMSGRFRREAQAAGGIGPGCRRDTRFHVRRRRAEQVPND